MCTEATPSLVKPRSSIVPWPREMKRAKLESLGLRLSHTHMVGHLRSHLSLLLSGSMRTLDFGPEGIVLHRMPTQQSRYPKTRQDFPHLHSLPPTYDEATSGRDRSVKVEEYVGSVSVAEPEGELGDTARSDDLPPSARRNDEAFSGLLPERPPPPYSAPPLHQTDIHEEEEEEGVSDNQPLLPA